MPGDVGGIARFLDEKARAPNQEIRAEQVLDGVEDRWVTHQLGEPREEQVRLVADLAPERAPVLGLDGLEPLAKRERLGGRQDGDREQQPVPVVALDRGRREPAQRVMASRRWYPKTRVPRPHTADRPVEATGPRRAPRRSRRPPRSRPGRARRAADRSSRARRPRPWSESSGSRTTRRRAPPGAARAAPRAGAARDGRRTGSRRRTLPRRTPRRRTAGSPRD